VEHFSLAATRQRLAASSRNSKSLSGKFGRFSETFALYKTRKFVGLNVKFCVLGCLVLSEFGALFGRNERLCNITGSMMCIGGHSGYLLLYFL
jgi:hypothetical protein